MRVLYKLAGIALLLCLIGVSFVGAVHAQTTQHRYVLYINSYHRGYKFSDDITAGIEKSLHTYSSDIELLVEYLDAKRLESDAYFDELARLYRIKYAHRKLDLIISSDDAALNFLFKYADELFPGVPVVFCGANYFDVNRLAGHERFTGVSELADVQGTLDLALTLHPQTRQIVVVNDTTVTGKRVHERLVTLEGRYPNVTFVYLEDLPMAEIRQRLSALPADSLVLLTIFSRDGAGEFFEYNIFTTLIAESSAVPVYGTWDFSLGFGIVGGKLTSGATEGERAARLAVRILNGERPQDIPVVQEPGARYMFDYVQLRRWNIPESRLPEDSVIINKPYSFVQQYAQYIGIAGVSFAILTVAVIMLALNVRRRRRVELRLTHSLDELQAIRASLEERIQERTAAFQKRANLLEAAAEISRATTEIIDLDRLLPFIVDLVQQHFNLYYVGLFLVDESGQWAVLRAGTGAAGQAMMAQGWRLEVGGKSMIGRCVATGQADIQLDVGEAAVHFDNPYLPATRSEMALPLRARGEILGAMTIQSQQVAAFEPDDIRTLQTMADQVAVAISNARLFEQAQASLEAERRAYGEISREAWRQVLMTAAGLDVLSDRAATRPAGDVWRPEMEAAWRAAAPVPGNGGTTLAVPIRVRDQVIGVVDGRKPDGSVWTAEEQQLLTTLVEQLGVALESARLYRDTQRRAAQERLVSEVTARIRETLNIETVLKTAVEEIREALQLERLVVRLGTPEDDTAPENEKG